MNQPDALFSPPILPVHVVERGTAIRRGWLRCQIGKNVEFTTALLQSYCIVPWEPVIYDALLVAAAVEFADRTQHRPAMSWQREFHLRIPVHEVNRWKNRNVSDALKDVLEFLTGDRWGLEFCSRVKAYPAPAQGQFDLPGKLTAVIPFSDGMDSRCVAGLLGKEMGDSLIRVRLGSKTSDGKALSRRRQPFTSIPYHVCADRRRFAESTARSRGFKFALISGLAAYLTKAGQVIVPESGQGALGPALITVGQAYEDYRSHPLFTERMEKFLDALLNHRVRFQFSQLWQTKAETLKRFVTECSDSSWANTWSCWQQTRQVSVSGKKRQCGICAACQLRRLSIHGAGLSDNKEMYVWENLSARTFGEGAATFFPKKKITEALKQYAIAGTLHLDHLARLRRSEADTGRLELAVFQLSGLLGLSEANTRAKLERLLKQHENEWSDFMGSLGPNSFLRRWSGEEQHAAA
jgi:7-cyano-7-deazaguanine synthase in queuosine biosynthesis